MTEPTAPHQLLEGVDRAALVLAVLAGAVTLGTTDGDWVPFTTFVGLLLCTIVAGFHRPVPAVKSPRSVLMRLAFGFAMSLSLLVTLAWPIQSFSDVSVPLSLPSLGIFTGAALLLAALEARISAGLDRTF